MKVSPLLLLPTIGCIALQVVSADTVTLKSGEVLQGKVLLANDREILMDVQVSPSIKDQRTIARSDVAAVDQKKPDEEAYGLIKDLRPPKTSASVQDFEEPVQKQLNPFLKKFPYSAYVPEVRKNVELFEAEEDRIGAGEIKIDGQWISAENYAANRSTYDAILAHRRLQQISDSGDVIGALNAFDRFEKSFKTSGAYIDVVVLTRKNLDTADKIAAAHLQNLPILKAKRDQGLAIASDDQKIVIAAGIEQDRKRAAQILDVAKSSGVRFVPILPENEESLKETRRLCAEESRRLAALPVSDWKRALALTDSALANLQKGEITEAQSSLAEAALLWPDSAVIKSAQERLLARKKEIDASNQTQAKSVDDAAAADPKKPGA